MIDVGIPLPGLFMFASIMRFKRCMSFRGLYSSQCRGIIESLAFCVLQTNPFEIRQALKTCICTGYIMQFILSPSTIAYVCVCVCVQNTESVNLSWLDDPCQLLIFETIDNHKRNFTDAAECTLLCFFGFLLLSGNRVDRDGNREYVGLSPESEQEGNNSLMVWMECWQIFCWRWPDQVLC